MLSTRMQQRGEARRLDRPARCRQPGLLSWMEIGDQKFRMQETSNSFSFVISTQVCILQELGHVGKKYQVRGLN